MKEKSKKQQTAKYIVCLLAILMLALIAATGAWFTDSKTGEEVKVNFGNIEIELGEGSTAIVLNADNETVTRDIMPDDTLRVSMLVGKATDTEDFYWKAKATVTIAGTSTALDSGWSSETYNTKEDTSAVTIDFKLDGDTYGNEFENKTVTIGYEVRAIQMANLTEAQAGYAIENNSEEVFASGENIELEEGVELEEIDLRGSEGIYFYNYVDYPQSASASSKSISVQDSSEVFLGVVSGYVYVGDFNETITEQIIPSHCEKDGKYYRVEHIDFQYEWNKSEMGMYFDSIYIPNTVKTINMYGQLILEPYYGYDEEGNSFIESFYDYSSQLPIDEIIFEENSALETFCLEYCGIEKLTLPKNVKNVIIKGCENLNIITFEEGLVELPEITTEDLELVVYYDNGMPEYKYGRMSGYWCLVLPVETCAISESVYDIYYCGTYEQWMQVEGNENVNTIYFYSEMDTGADNIWHYNEYDGLPNRW